mgnify:CR=1 FL=1
MIQSDRFFNKLTLTNDNIPDDKLLGSCFYLTSKVIDETAVKAKNILNSNTLSFVYNASVEYLYQSFNRFLIISLDVLICRYSPLLRAFPALFISEEPHKSFYCPSCFRSQK